MIAVGAIAILIVALLIGAPVQIAFFTSAFFILFMGDYDASFLITYASGRLQVSVLLAIPLFILAGALINRADISARLINIIELFVGRMRGGLGAVMIVSCAVFGAITGSAAATLSAIGSAMLPRLAKAGYPAGYAAALIASAAVIGMLIPPSSLMILFAWVGRQSVLAAFLACFFPGIILATLLVACNYYLSRRMKLPVSDAAMFSTGELGRRTAKAGPGLLLPFVVLGGIYAGVVTPTEAAAVSAVYAIVIGFVFYRTLSLRAVWEELVVATRITGVLMMMLFAISILSRLYLMEDVPGLVLGALQSISDERWAQIIIMNVVMMVIGMLMDDVSGVLLSTPIFLPVATEIGLDPIHFAAILGVNIGMGNITPPCAPLLYLAVRMNGGSTMEALRVTGFLFLFAWVPTLLLTSFVPALSLWLPGLLLGYGQ
jgi:tripartite ATP-independent transporter DctM subunit